MPIPVLDDHNTFSKRTEYIIVTSTSRRRILKCVPAILTGVSGCTGQNYQSEDTSTTPTATKRKQDFPHSTKTPVTKKVRASSGTFAVRSSTFTPASEWKTTEWLVSSEDERDAITFSNGASGVEDAKKFLNGFDFSNKTVLIVQYPINKCRTKKLELLKWGPANGGSNGTASFWLEFSIVKRETSCEESPEEDIEATLVQVPDDVDRIYSITTKGSYQN